jgi:hypothetical protein
MAGRVPNDRLNLLNKKPLKKTVSKRVTHSTKKER